MKSTLLSIVTIVIVALLSVGVGSFGAGAFAQAGGDHGHGGPMEHGKPGGKTVENDAVQAFMAANERMHEGMMIEFTGNPDIDFARGMIPHHQGAIDMAQIVLEHGSDPEIRQLAEEIIAAQETEIQFLREWLQRNK